MTTRAGGVSTGERASLDLGGHGDTRADVIEHRRRLRTLLPREPLWLHQVHGARVVTFTGDDTDPVWPEADAAVTSSPGVVGAVRVADCLPVFLADAAGSCVGIAHAGWRGLAAGVVEATLAAMRTQGSTRQIA